MRIVINVLLYKLSEYDEICSLIIGNVLFY